jgi:CheY-like chemotaxis protein
MTRTVVIVDDEFDVRDAVAALFEMRGWQTIQAEDGSDALALALEHLPDLVVLDVMMAVQDGFVTLKQLRQDPRTSHLPVIMLSAVNQFELSTRHDAQSVGRATDVPPPEAFLEKPVDAKALAETLDAIFA